MGFCRIACEVRSHITNNCVKQPILIQNWLHNVSVRRISLENIDALNLLNLYYALLTLSKSIATTLHPNFMSACDQLPGAAPRSRTVASLLTILSFS